ncbi:CapA family protein [Niallia sp.]|uniref:CapA family protein n=1 Tax=Niallia sp. TaxID=2837523 RepID=UPI00289B34D0|nr:CapA family protein [Niallia sp.]
MDKLSIAVTGDALVTQRLPREDERLIALKEILGMTDVRFTNLETSIHSYENDIYPSKHSGGDWINAEPAVLSDLSWLGFNIMSCPSNHSLDWSHSGLLRTMENLNREQVVYAGIGRNLSEASRPRYLETSKGRVAIIAVNTTFRDWHPAGEQRKDFIGRPGINPLHFRTIHKVNEEQLNVLKRVAEQTEINKRILNNEDGLFKFGDYFFEAGDSGTYTVMNPFDAKRIKKSISEALRQADIVLVSCHSHEMRGLQKEQLTDFQREFAHMVIDEGAHAYIGHGPHVLRGIEIYKKRPIFHGLGDFFYQAELIERQPTEFYEKYGNLYEEHCTADGYDFRVKSGGIMNNETNPKTYESIIATFDISDNHVNNIVLHPITLGFDQPRSKKGTPEIAKKEASERIISELQHLSSSFGTEIEVKDGKGIITNLVY